MTKILFMLILLSQINIRPFGSGYIATDRNSVTIVRKFGNGYIQETNKSGKRKVQTIRRFGKGFLIN